MARNNVTYSCGCGFSTKDLEEAGKHADETNHTLTANGTVHPDSK